MTKTRIVSFGSYVPPRVVKNSDLVGIMNTSDEWIQQRSGILERRWIEEGETMGGMALKASQKALANAKWTADDIDLIIFTSLLGDYLFPGTGCLLQRDLKCKKNIPALDIRNQCSGFLYALQVADSFIRAGTYKRILIAASEIHSTSLNHTPEGRDVGVLFGDAAASCIVEAHEGEGAGEVLDVLVYSQGEFAEKLAVTEPSPNHIPRMRKDILDDPKIYPFMDGKLVFKNAVDRMVESMGEVCKKNNVAIGDVNFVIPHQANKRINQAVMQYLGLPESKTHYTLDRFGNTTSATIPLTFEEAVDLKKIKRGDLVALTAFGSGFTWGSALVRY